MATTDSALPHTLDNLCNEDKAKLIDMIKQLKDGKSKCKALEQEIEELHKQNEELKKRSVVMNGQLSDMEKKVFESVDSSNISESKIQSLTSELQKSVFNRKTSRERYKEAQGEVQMLQDKLNSLKGRYEKEYVNNMSQTKFKYVSRTTNTFDTALKLDNADIQCELADEIERSIPKVTSYSTSRVISESDAIPSWNESGSFEELDEDITKLILSLN